MSVTDCYRCESQTLYQGDALGILSQLPAESVHCAVTSPPYWGLRDYGLPPTQWPDGSMCCFGLEKTPELYVEHAVLLFRAVRRVLRDDGTLWLNMGDSYNAHAGNGHGYQDGRTNRDKRKSTANVSGLKPKDLCGIPWRVAFALQADGWYLRSDIIWSKPNPMPESVTDRPTKAHEYLFLLSKRSRYYYDGDAIKEGREGNTHSRGTKRQPPIDSAGIGHKDWVSYMTRDEELTSRNRRSVWTIPTAPYSDAHFATFPPALVEPCIMAGTSEKGCCPECGAPWVRVVEKQRVRTRPGKDSKSYDRITGEVEDDGIEKPWRDRAEIGNRDPDRHVTESTTLGWEPGCECWPMVPCNIGVGEVKSLEPYTPVPCTVLDPFLGSGTTLQVARWLGRRGIGIELSPEYCELAKRRIGQPREKPATVKPATVKPAAGQMEMFVQEPQPHGGTR